jgi:hypothetical protein
MNCNSCCGLLIRDPSRSGYCLFKIQWVAKLGRLVAKLGKWVAKLLALLLAPAALGVRIQTSLKNTKWAIKATAVAKTL